MKRLLLIAICIVTAATAWCGQPTQSLSFSNPGPVSPGTFHVSVSLTFAEYSAVGISYWLEVSNAIAPFLTITDATFFTFTGQPPLPPGGIPFNLGGEPGFSTENFNLGGTAQQPVAMGTYLIADFTFTLAAGAPAGTYSLRSTVASPRTSEVTDSDFNDHNLPQAAVSLIVVPEPGPLSLCVLGSAFLLGSAGQLRRRSRNRALSGRRHR